MYTSKLRVLGEMVAQGSNSGLLAGKAFQGTEHPQHFPQLELWPAAVPEAHGQQEPLEKALSVTVTLI